MSTMSIKLEFVYTRCPSCSAYVSLDIALLPERIAEMRPLLEKIPARCSMCHKDVPTAKRVLRPRTGLSGLIVDRENK